MSGWYWGLLGGIIVIVICFVLMIWYLAGRRAKVEVVKDPDPPEVPLPPLGVPSVLPNGGKHPAGTPLVVIPVPHASAYFRIGHPHNVHVQEFTRLDGGTIVLGAPHPCSIPGGSAGGNQWQIGQFVIQAFCYAPGREDSEITTAMVEITPPTGEVFFSHTPGEYDEPFALSLFHHETSNIMFTVDGSDPWEVGIPYLNPLFIDRTCEIRAAAQGTRAPALCKRFVIPEELPQPIVMLNGEVVTEGWAPGADYIVSSPDSLGFSSREGGSVYFSVERVSPLDNIEELFIFSGAMKPTCLYTSPPQLSPGRWLIRAFCAKPQWKDSRVLSFTAVCRPHPPTLSLLHRSGVGSTSIAEALKKNGSVDAPCTLKICRGGSGGAVSSSGEATISSALLQQTGGEGNPPDMRGAGGGVHPGSATLSISYRLTRISAPEGGGGGGAPALPHHLAGSAKSPEGAADAVWRSAEPGEEPYVQIETPGGYALEFSSADPESGVGSAVIREVFYAEAPLRAASLAPPRFTRGGGAVCTLPSLEDQARHGDGIPTAGGAGRFPGHGTAVIPPLPSGVHMVMNSRDSGPTVRIQVKVQRIIRKAGEAPGGETDTNSHPQPPRVDDGSGNPHITHGSQDPPLGGDVVDIGALPDDGGAWGRSTSGDPIASSSSAAWGGGARLGGEAGPEGTQRDSRSNTGYTGSKLSKTNDAPVFPPEFLHCMPGEEVCIQQYGVIRASAVAYHSRRPEDDAVDYSLLSEEAREAVGASTPEVQVFTIVPPPPRLCPGGSGSFSTGFAANVYKPRGIPEWAECSLHYTVSGWCGGVEMQAKSFRNAADGSVVGLADEGHYVIRAKAEVFPKHAASHPVFSEEVEGFYEVCAAFTPGPAVASPRRASLPPPVRDVTIPPPAFHPLERYHPGDTLHVYLQDRSGDPETDLFYSVNTRILSEESGGGVLYTEDYPIVITKEMEVDLPPHPEGQPGAGDGGSRRGVMVYAVCRPRKAQGGGDNVTDLAGPSAEFNAVSLRDAPPKSGVRLPSRVVEKTYCLGGAVSRGLSEPPSPAASLPVRAPPRPTLTCHASQLSLQLKTPGKGARAMYTVDGSTPMAEPGGSTYELPFGHAFAIPSRGTTDVRAVCVDSTRGKAPSKVVSKCFVEGTLPQLPLARSAAGLGVVEMHGDHEGAGGGATPAGCLPPPIFVAHARVVIVVAASRDPAAIIRYSVDGSAPGPGSPAMPPSGVQIAVHGGERPATLRCAAFDPTNTMCSEEVVQDFMQIYAEGGGAPEIIPLSPGGGFGEGGGGGGVGSPALDDSGVADVGDVTVEVPQPPASASNPIPEPAAPPPPPGSGLQLASVDGASPLYQPAPAPIPIVQATGAVDAFARGFAAERLRQARREAVLADLRKQEKELREEAARKRG